MARRRSRRNDGLVANAITSDWKVGASLGATCLLTAAFVIPGLSGGGHFVVPAVRLLSPIVWVLAVVFGGISVLRFLQQRKTRNVRAGTGASGRNPESSASGGRANGAPVDALAEPIPQPRPEAWSLDVLTRIEWKRFEDLCCAFYQEKGIRAETTRLGPDGGIDIHLYQDDSDSARATAIVQCKAWNQQVGVKPVRELRGVMAHEQVGKAFFMAPNGFTEEARAFAAANQITLLDGKLILAMLQRLSAESAQRLLELATSGDWTTPTCPSCGGGMVARAGKNGEFWGCANYPKCRRKVPMRSSAMRSSAKDAV